MQLPGRGYTSEVDTVDEATWCDILREFDDANIYQTWSHAAVVSGQKNLCKVVVKKDGKLVAAALTRIAQVPYFDVGIAYVRWGPLWRHRATAPNLDTFRQALRALRNEFVCRRRLVLRLFPIVFADDSIPLSSILAEEGFSPTEDAPVRTILMNLNPSIEELRAGMKRNWKRNLKVAEQSGLQVIEGTTKDLCDFFLGIYKEMMARKKFVETTEVYRLSAIQAGLAEDFKLKIMLCRADEALCAGLVWSEIGTMAIELFAATTSAALENRASYLLRWMLVEKLKHKGFVLYNLNGINPAKNPGGYKFNTELAGKHGHEVQLLGRFDSHVWGVSYPCVEWGDKVRRFYRLLRGRLRNAPDMNALGEVAEPKLAMQMFHGRAI